MKHLHTFILVLISLFAFAQKEVYFQVNHKINDAVYSTSQEGVNELGNTYTFSRVQYYISDIKVIHDGGQVEEIEDTWVLIDATQPTYQFLESLPITHLESVSFSIGIDSSLNHLDPSTYPVGHPLGHSSSLAGTLHWAWDPGYIFIAMEGTSNGNTFEIHSLGDMNYFEQNITTSGAEVDGKLIISIDADYEKALTAIDVSSGLEQKGETGESKVLIQNFNNHVFTEASELGTLSIKTKKVNENFSFSPNPIASNQYLKINSDWENGEVIVKDITGKTIFTKAYKEGVLRLDMESGVYFVSIKKDNSYSVVRKLIVK